MTKPYNGKAAVPGNRTMVAPVLQERSQVDALHAKAGRWAARMRGRPSAAQRGRRHSAAPISVIGNKPCANKPCAVRIGPAS